jgi:hypothetical protein
MACPWVLDNPSPPCYNKPVVFESPTVQDRGETYKGPHRRLQMPSAVFLCSSGMPCDTR